MSAERLPVGTSEQAAKIVAATNHLLGILADGTCVIGTPGDHAAIERVRCAQHAATVTAFAARATEGDEALVTDFVLAIGSESRELFTAARERILAALAARRIEGARDALWKLSGDLALRADVLQPGVATKGEGR